MVAIADQVILLADASKFGQQSFTHVMNLEQVSAIITDEGIAEETLAALSDRSISVTVV